jgi:hypothetical protein
MESEILRGGHDDIEYRRKIPLERKDILLSKWHDRLKPGWFRTCARKCWQSAATANSAWNIRIGVTYLEPRWALQGRPAEGVLVTMELDGHQVPYGWNPCWRTGRPG